MNRNNRRASVRVVTREIDADASPYFMSEAGRATDARALARIQSYNHGDLYGQVVVDSGVTLNGQPVKMLVADSSRQPRDLMDHADLRRTLRVGTASDIREKKATLMATAWGMAT